MFEILSTQFSNEIAEIVRTAVAEALEADRQKRSEEQKTPRTYTRQQVCKIMQISLPTLHRLINSGQVRSFKVGAKTLIDADKFDRDFSAGRIGRYLHTSKI